MNSSLQIGRIMGIPVKLHITFLLIIPWIAWAFATQSIPFFGRAYGFGAVEPPSIRWIYSFAFSILLFACVALHELGHSYVAKRYGISIQSITLYLFGGVSAMEEIPRDPKLEFRMASAGPAVSGLLGLASLLLYSPSASSLGEGHPFTVLLWSLGVVNITLMIFNLIPAFPMDGGRVLRAWFATWMPYIRATRTAATIGKAFAAGMFLLGLFPFNPLLLIIAAFVYMGASEEERMTAINICLEGIKVRDIMSAHVMTVPPEMNLMELRDQIFRDKHRGYPVVQDGKILGFVTSADIQKVPDEERERITVGEVMARKIYDIGPDEEATAAMKILTARGVRRLPVMEEGTLIGILSREDLVRAMELCSKR
jgi:Zn-dependent protease/CBS domain-containing protein